MYSVLLYYGLFAGCDVEAFLGVKNLSAHKVVKWAGGCGLAIYITDAGQGA